MGIYCNIDEVLLEKKDIVKVSGWAISEKKTVSITVLNCEVLEIKKIQRNDVKNAFQHLEIDENCGFELYLKSKSNEIKIKLFTDISENEIPINLKELRVHRLKQRVKKLGYVTTNS